MIRNLIFGVLLDIEPEFTTKHKQSGQEFFIILKWYQKCEYFKKGIEIRLLKMNSTKMNDSSG